MVIDSAGRITELHGDVEAVLRAYEPPGGVAPTRLLRLRTKTNRRA